VNNEAGRQRTRQVATLIHFHRLTHVSLVKFCDFARISHAIAGSKRGSGIKPVLPISQSTTGR